MHVYIKLKRFIDVVLSLISMMILSPVFIIIPVFIKMDSKGSVFFKQKRIGPNKKEFYMIKFRTMYVDTPKDVPTHLLTEAHSHITAVGKFLRRSSLDELPQLINILKGEMSIVGPRPALWNQFDLIAERDRNNAGSVRPGLTGWAQINGRDDLPIEVKARYDGEYVNKMSFLFDLMIIFRTFFSILKSEGIREGKE
jgi:O-antigen biosynthesis protein WbqP